MIGLDLGWCLPLDYSARGKDCKIRGIPWSEGSQMKRMPFPPVISIGEVSAPHSLVSMALGAITAQGGYKKGHLTHPLLTEVHMCGTAAAACLLQVDQNPGDAGSDQSRESGDPTAELRGSLKQNH